MSFSTEVELSLTVPQSELRSVRSEIEGGLGDVSMGVSGGGGGGGSSAPQSQNRRLFRWARQRTRDMDTTVTLLESIDDTLEEGGGGIGGGGGSGLLSGAGGRLGVSILGGAGGAAALSTAGTVTVGALAVTGVIAASALAIDELVGAETLIDPENTGDPQGPGSLTLGPTGGIFTDVLEQVVDDQQQTGAVEIPGLGDFTNTIDTAPQWFDGINSFLNGEAESPGWVQDFIDAAQNEGGGGPSSFERGSPNAPGAEFGPPLDVSPEQADTTTPGGAQPAQINVEVPRTEGADIVTQRDVEQIAERKAGEMRDEIERALSPDRAQGL